jgi:release factor glutamine methyltransferase
MTFRQFYQKNDFSKINKAVFFYLLFFLSKTVKNYDDFVKNIESDIDFNFEIFKKHIQEYLKNKSLSHIIKRIKFLNIELDIFPNILSPRDETENLVQDLIELFKKDDFFKKKRKIRVIDVCCGSGNIGLSLKKNIDCEVDCLDIEQNAIKNTKHNAKLNNLRIKTILTDCTDFSSYKKKYDILVCNPPYVFEKDFDISLLENEDKKCFIDKKGDFFIYKFLISNYKIIMNKKSLMVFEIGINMEDELEKYLLSFKTKFNFYFKKDLSQITRVLYV